VSKFKLNDRVTVARIVRSQSEGWDNTWIEPDMTQCVGHIFRIMVENDGTGYRLHHTCECCNKKLNPKCFSFPLAALEKYTLGVAPCWPREPKEPIELESELSELLELLELEDLIFQ
jgi:hypothetical protein